MKKCEVAAQFAEDDPRRPPYALEDRLEAAVMTTAPHRWHLFNGADWFAIRLQHGRGIDLMKLSRIFGVGYSTIRQRAAKEGWVKAMSEYDRRRLSRLVWLGGLAREKQADPALRAMLARASEWRLVLAQGRVTFEPRDKRGEAPPMMILNDEEQDIPQDIPDDAYFSERDPKREERISVVQQLERKLAALEAQWMAPDPGAFEAGDAGALPAYHDAVVGVHPGDVERAAEAHEDMAALGGEGAASA
jgi:hypothetical protein